MVLKRLDEPPSSEITDESVYLRRREFLAGGAALALAGIGVVKAALPTRPKPASGPTADLPGVLKSAYSVDEPSTSYEDVTHYNNYYEFGTAKDDPAEKAGDFKPRPWTLTVDGEVGKGGTFDLDALMKQNPLEERVYRFRCVEAWSMVIPWVGFPLASLLKRVEPTSKARFVAFTSVKRPEEMPGQSSPFISWPYVEGLRLDEAMHPLTLMAVGLYGKTLPNQNGAPLRLVTPWKYGFKGAKAIVRMTLTETQPPTTWNLLAAREYGFFANVNPGHDHPRWSQARERRIGELRRRPTLMWNGYPEVASLYKNLDLDVFF